MEGCGLGRRDSWEGTVAKVESERGRASLYEKLRMAGSC